MSSPTWKSDDTPKLPRPRGLGWVRVLWRGLPLALVVLAGLVLTLLLRLIEAPLHGMQRPWTPRITVAVCRTALWLLGIGYERRGQPMDKPGAIVANHASWLDIFVLNAGGRVYFVSKSEVAKWPGIGWLAKATGTVFISRERRDAAAQKAVFEERLKAGHRLLFFPEGTSTDGLRVLPFKPTLFAAFFSEELRDLTWIQPVTVTYHAPENRDARFYGWWGEMGFGEHLLAVLAQPRQGRVEVDWGTPVAVGSMSDRKALAKRMELDVAAAHLSAARSVNPAKS